MSKVTIITISYNAQDVIEKTILSVLSQEFKSFEYIIIDGNSKDNTVEVIKRYESEFSRKGFSYRFISEADEGIYDAMNKGIKISNGEWLLFLNTGDTLYNPQVLNRFNKEVDETKAIFYGANYCQGVFESIRPFHYIYYGEMIACHQSIFFNKGILKDDLVYDLNYKIFADYEILVKVLKRYGRNFFQSTSTVISDYEGGGISEPVSYQKRKDKYSIIFKYYGFVGVLVALWYRIVIMPIKLMIKGSKW